MKREALTDLHFIIGYIVSNSISHVKNSKLRLSLFHFDQRTLTCCIVLFFFFFFFFCYCVFLLFFFLLT